MRGKEDRKLSQHRKDLAITTLEDALQVRSGRETLEEHRVVEAALVEAAVDDCQVPKLRRIRKIGFLQEIQMSHPFLSAAWKTISLNTIYARTSRNTASYDPLSAPTEHIAHS